MRAFLLGSKLRHPLGVDHDEQVQQLQRMQKEMQRQRLTGFGVYCYLSQVLGLRCKGSKVQKQTSVSQLKSSISIQPQNGSRSCKSYYNLGMDYSTMGKLVSAFEYMKKGLVLMKQNGCTDNSVFEHMLQTFKINCIVKGVPLDEELLFPDIYEYLEIRDRYYVSLYLDLAGYLMEQEGKENIYALLEHVYHEFEDQRDSAAAEDFLNDALGLLANIRSKPKLSPKIQSLLLYLSAQFTNTLAEVYTRSDKPEQALLTLKKYLYTCPEINEQTVRNLAS